MNEELFHKFETLLDWFRQQENVTVAYSGGVDSALLLFLGSQILGDQKCRGFSADTCLVSSTSRESCLNFAKNHDLNVHFMQVDPLEFDGFKNNKIDRCYICKKKTYQFFLKNMAVSSILIDGTHCDDLTCDRPGFKAVQELHVATPFIDCQLGKFDIRSLSYHLGLSTWSKLSDSCLATRVKCGFEITLKELQVIDRIESEFNRIGLGGCRVSIGDYRVLLTVGAGQRDSCINGSLEKPILDIVKRYKFSKVFLDLSEREGILPSLLDYIGFTGDKGPKKQLTTCFN